MRTYSKISPQFWNGKTGRELKAKGTDAVTVALYLLTCQHANMLGLYFLSKTYIAVDTGLSLERAAKGLQGACEVGFCQYDEGSEMVWVEEMAAHQIGTNLEAIDNRCKGVQKAFNTLPENPFLQGFFTKYASAFHLVHQRDTTSEPASGSQVTPKPIGSQEQEQKQEVSEPKVHAHDKPTKGSAPPCPFEAIQTAWNDRVISLRKIRPPREWSPTRKRDMQARWQERWSHGKYDTSESGLKYWEIFFDLVESSDFLCGRGARPWGRCGFDWVLKSANFCKIIEGNYATTQEQASDGR